MLEAQQVMDLLKVQELDDYLRGIEGNQITAQGLDYWPSEAKILAIHEESLGLEPSFIAFLAHPEVASLARQLRRQARGQNLNPETLHRLQQSLQQINQGALLYPLILEDRLELVLVTSQGLTRHRVSVNRQELNRAIAQFRTELVNRRSDPRRSAQRLYDWLLRPLDDQRREDQIQTLIYAADGQLRYIPLAALHDGDQWLTQRLTINHITAASLTNFDRPMTTDVRILAGAFTEGQYHYEVGDRHFVFAGLPYAGVEVENIAQAIPSTETYFNQQFSPKTVIPRMGEHDIVHLATHATFVLGAPEDSFIVFGNGERVTLSEIAHWHLPAVELVVLSACETAVSGLLGTGEEILGFGYQIQRTGAAAAIASLWRVSDGGTQALMNAFYAARQAGHPNVAALRLAQIALITGDQGPGGRDRAPATILLERLSPEVFQAANLSHPYYWAAFILIGNGL